MLILCKGAWLLSIVNTLVSKSVSTPDVKSLTISEIVPQGTVAPTLEK